MATLPIGLFLLTTILMLSTPMAQWTVFLNIHSILIVLGGSVAILSFSTPYKVLKELFISLRALLEKESDIKDHAQEITQLIESRRLTQPSENPLINYAIELWDNGSSLEIFHVLLSQKKEKLESTSAEAVQSLRNLAKYPPALGMTGTVMGLVNLFVNLKADNRSNIGPALGLALTATFFGLLIANGVVMPLADRLHVVHMRNRAHLQSIYELLLLINRREPPSLIESEVTSRGTEAA